MKSTHVNLEQKSGRAEGVAVSQCVIHHRRESAVPPPTLLCVHRVSVPPPTSQSCDLLHLLV